MEWEGITNLILTSFRWVNNNDDDDNNSENGDDEDGQVDNFLSTNRYLMFNYA